MISKEDLTTEASVNSDKDKVTIERHPDLDRVERIDGAIPMGPGPCYLVPKDWIKEDKEIENGK